MITEAKIDQFYKDVDSLQLRFPGAAIAKATGFTKGVVSQYLSRSLKPSESFITKFYSAFGESLKKVPQETTLNPHEKAFLNQRRDQKNAPKEETLMFYDVHANAATRHTGDILPVKKGEGVLHISDLFKGSQYAIRISGNSMTPNYPSGAIIGIRLIEDKQITPGSVYVIEKGDDLWLKRLYYKDDDQSTGVFQAISDNTMLHDKGPRQGKLCYPAFDIIIDQVRKLFKVTGIYKPNELTVIN